MGEGLIFCGYSYLTKQVKEGEERLFGLALFEGDVSAAGE